MKCRTSICVYGSCDPACCNNVIFVQAEKEEKTASEAKERAEETRLDKAVKTLLSLKLSETQESGTGA